MNLEEEIAIYQFGQGIHSDTAILGHFSQLDEDTQKIRLYDLYDLVLPLNPVSSDIEQAIKDSSLTPTDVPCVTLKQRQLRQGIFFLPDGENEQVAELLLYVFKIVYQRAYTLKQENSTDWWYQDLSKPEIVQAIRTRHRELAEEIYMNSSFRSEFACLAKLWYEFIELRKGNVGEPKPDEPEIQTKFNFLTYNDMIGKVDTVIGKSIAIVEDKLSHGIGVLQGSVRKGLAAQYKLTSEQARLLLVDVIERHMQEVYKVNWRPYF
ncbi:hypothetical protein GO730_13090 [Spirosoma sp. HMF3257]|nr:hypothetical protein [Spirosoma telluris]